MVSCNGKINSYGINGFLDIYNLLTYKFYNHNKSVINKDYIAFLTHLPYNNLYGLSMSHVFDWNVGSAMIFDSSLLHCSNDFFPDTAEKHALNIFTAKKL